MHYCVTQTDLLHYLHDIVHFHSSPSTLKNLSTPWCMWQVLDCWGPELLVSPTNIGLCLAIGVQSVWMVSYLPFSPIPTDAQLLSLLIQFQVPSLRFSTRSSSVVHPSVHCGDICGWRERVLKAGSKQLGNSLVVCIINYNQPTEEGLNVITSSTKHKSLH